MRSEPAKKENFPTFAQMDVYETLTCVRDSQIQDGVMAYAGVLAATREIFGTENMSEDVMIAAIQAASYIGYRGVMGPKYTEQTSTRRI